MFLNAGKTFSPEKFQLFTYPLFQMRELLIYLPTANYKLRIRPPIDQYNCWVPPPYTIAQLRNLLNSSVGQKLAVQGDLNLTFILPT